MLVQQDQPAAGQYTVALVSVDGKTVATATGRERSVADARVNNTPILPEVSISDSRVYYLDGDSRVKFVAPDGTTGDVATAPGDSHTHAVFSISPDDSRLAVALVDYASSPPRLRLYVEDVRGGTKHQEIFSSTSLYEWPVGWLKGNIILALGHPFIDMSVPPNPYWAADGYHLIDQTGTRVATVPSGGLPCHVTGAISPAGTVCVWNPGQFQVETIDWTGVATVTLVNPSPFDIYALSPNGIGLTRADERETTIIEMQSQSGDVRIATAREAAGWIDDTHIVVRVSSTSPALSVVSLPKLLTVSASAEGQFVGRLPIDLT